jgi:myo-inositol-1(or 4)-monophosphatase
VVINLSGRDRSPAENDNTCTRCLTAAAHPLTLRLRQPLTPDSAAEILADLNETLDGCRRLLAGHPGKVSLETTSDGGRETVTELDLQVEQRLVARVHELQPEAGIIGEETTQDLSALDQEVCFVLDPIDGTDLLLAGGTVFAISIAILARRHAVAGLLDFPARDQRFTCTLGGGTWLNGRRIQALRSTSLAEARISISSTQHALTALHPLWNSLGVAAVVPTPGFTAKLATLMRGECDAALYLPIQPRSTAIWDYAAAALLLSEAGGTLSTWDGTDLLDALPAACTGGWIAGNPALSAALRRAVTDGLVSLQGHRSGDASVQR